jgi:soluble P-type ATPase
MENDYEKAFEALGEMVASLSVTMQEMTDTISSAFEKGFKKIDIDFEIECIKANPGLNRFQKWRLIRELRKQKKYLQCEEEYK